VNLEIERVESTGLQRVSADALVRNQTAANFAVPRLALALGTREVALPDGTGGDFWARRVTSTLSESSFVWLAGQRARQLLSPDNRAGSFGATLASNEELVWARHAHPPRPVRPNPYLSPANQRRPLPPLDWRPVPIADQITRLPVNDITSVDLAGRAVADNNDVARALSRFPQMHSLRGAPLNSKLWTGIGSCQQLRFVEVTQLVLGDRHKWSEPAGFDATTLGTVGAAAPQLEALSLFNVVEPLCHNVLAAFRQLRELSILGPSRYDVSIAAEIAAPISGPFLDGLGELAELERLEVSGTFDDLSRVVIAVKRLEKLRRLGLPGAELDPAAIHQLACLPALESAQLNLGSHETVGALGSLGSVQTLGLNTPWTLEGADLALIARVPRLRHLALNEVDLSHGIPNWWSRLDSVWVLSPHGLSAQVGIDYERRHPGARLNWEGRSKRDWYDRWAT
jgi:hypothetical protein